MADLEAVLADVSYLMAMEKSQNEPSKRSTKKVQLPDRRFLFYLYERAEAFVWRISTRITY